MLLGILFAYTVNPLVVWLERIRVPRVLGTTIVMIGVVCALVLVERLENYAIVHA